MSAVGSAGAVQGEDLVAQDVSAWLEGGRDGYGPGVVGCGELVFAPRAGSGTGDQTDLVEFCEFKSGLVNCGAVVAGTGSQVVKDRTWKWVSVVQNVGSDCL